MQVRHKFKSFYCLLIISSLIFGKLADIKAAEADSLKYFGHSFVQIKTVDNKNIYIDPYAVNAFKDSADIVLVTHEHYDHNELTRVKQRANCTVIRSSNAIKSGVYQTFTVGNIKITAVAAYNANHSKSSCVGYVIEFDGIKLYHSGDTGKIPEMADLSNLNLDYALLCMDGIYTMTPEEATEAAAMINAKVDIPIHTMPPPDTYSDQIVARFTSPNKLVVKPGTVIALSSVTTSIRESKALPSSFELMQNYPNPFNPTTKIEYSIAEGQHITLKVYDTLGREVATLVDENKEAGNFEVTFNGSSLSNGIYFYRLQSGSLGITKKFVLLK